MYELTHKMPDTQLALFISIFISSITTVTGKNLK